MTRANDNGPDPKIVRLKVAEFPKGVKDVADLLNTPGGADAFGAMIRNARPGPSWMISNVGEIPGVTEHDLSTVDGKVAATGDLIDMLLRQPPIAREQYAAELAAKLDCSVAAVKETLDEALALRRGYYAQHPQERPWRHEDPNGEIGMDIPS